VRHCKAMAKHKFISTVCVLLDIVKCAIVICCIGLCVYGGVNGVQPSGVYVNLLLEECILKCVSRPSCIYVGYARGVRACSVYSTEFNCSDTNGCNNRKMYILQKADFDPTHAKVILITDCEAKHILYNRHCFSNVFLIRKDGR